MSGAPRTWDVDSPQRVWLDDAAQLINAETGLRVVAADVRYVEHKSGEARDTEHKWTTVVIVSSYVPILSAEQQQAITSGDGKAFHDTVYAVINHIKSHPVLYFG